MKISDQLTVGEFVTNDFRTAAIFSKYKIDFCCKGGVTLEDVCEKKGIDKSQLLNELDAILGQNSNSGTDFKAFSAPLLIDYILEIHHKYIEEKTPILLAYLSKLCKVHGERHPELFEINNLFQISAGSLAQHMFKEENVLFPFIKEMQNAIEKEVSIQQPHFGTVENPIAMMSSEHENEGEIFRRIAELTNNYTPPSDACQTYKVTYAMLEEFERDLHKHIHLENNILFNKAIELESRFIIS